MLRGRVNMGLRHHILRRHVTNFTHEHLWIFEVGYVRVCHSHLYMTCSHQWHDSCTCVTCLIHMSAIPPYTWSVHMCDMTHSHVWHYSCTCVTWRVLICLHFLVIHDLFIHGISLMLMYICDMSHLYVCLPTYTWLVYVYDATHVCMSYDSFICVTWPIHMCDMTRSYVWHDSCICVPWLIHTCDIPNSYMWHDSFICVTGLNRKCDMIHSCMWRASFIRVLFPPTRGKWRIHMCNMTQFYVCPGSCTRVIDPHATLTYTQKH